MKELSIEEKAKAYDEAYKVAESIHRFSSNLAEIKRMEDMFPELKESEDERIKKSLIEFVKQSSEVLDKQNQNNMIDWLEKQGEKKVSYTTLAETGNGGINALVTKELPTNSCNEQKPADKVEPKFKVGDWVVWQDKCYKVNYNGCGYELVDQNGLSTSLEYGTIDENARFWGITKDAKDGDVLAYVTDEEDLWIMIYWSLYEPYEGHVHYHVLLVNDNFSDKGTCCICINDLKPATKEQCDLLFKKMNEAGYEWDAEKKKLSKRVIDEGKSEMDYCFTKMMNGEKVSPTWSEDDDEILRTIISDGIRGAEFDMLQINWLKSLKDRIGG